jgi:ABC-type Fe3+/spermidine/putrescine transport system ATPase subunit
VTHDYADAISLAKRVGVIHNGKIIQEGSVEDVFRNPVNRFVARYAGIRNFFRVDVTGVEGSLTGISDHKLRFKLNGAAAHEKSLLLVKSESIEVSNEMPEDNNLNSFRGKVTEIIPSQFGMEVTIDAGDLFYVNILSSDMVKLNLTEGKEVWVNFASEAIVVLSGN